MNKKDEKRFLMAMAQTRVTLPGPNLTEEEKTIRTQVFWNELERYRIEAVEKAFQKAIRNLRFFPTPSEIINFIEEGNEEKKVDLIEWVPTKEGKEKARQLINDLYKRWDKEDREREKKRAEEFEKKRRNLQAQAKLFKKEKI